MERWLEHTSYTEGQKQQIRDHFLDNPEEFVRFQLKACGSFIKDEMYIEKLAAPRGINARQNVYKAAFGPFIKELEKMVYESPHFIKHIPASKRPAYIKTMMESETPVIVEGDDGIFRIKNKIYYTDFSSFEALFTEEFSEATEQKAFRRYLSRFPEFGKRLFDLIDRVAWGPNVCVFNYHNGDFRTFLKFIVWLKRMSGEMWTSLGNGFANLMVILYAIEQASLGVVIDVEWFRRLGLLCKLEVHNTIDDGTFCGLIFDSDALQAITDPRSTLIKFGWTNKRYAYVGRRLKLKLLRAKALSLAYETPACPILSTFAKRVLHLTDRIADSVAVTLAEDRWYKEQLLFEMSHGGPPFAEPHPLTRQLFARRFGISLRDQLIAESYIEKMELGPVPLEVVQILQFDQLNYDLWDEYVTATPADRCGFVPRATWRDLSIMQRTHDEKAKDEHFFRKRRRRQPSAAGRAFPTVEGH